MSSTLEQIQKIIQKAGIDGALTPDAINLFNKTIEKAKALKIELEELQMAHKTLDENYLNRGAKLDRVRSELKAYNEREDQLEEREKEMFRLELTAEYEAERVKDHKEMFNTVFRNLETRRSIFTPVPGLPSDQYGTPILPIVDHDIEETKTE